MGGVGTRIKKKKKAKFLDKLNPHLYSHLSTFTPCLVHRLGAGV